MGRRHKETTGRPAALAAGRVATGLLLTLAACGGGEGTAPSPSMATPPAVPPSAPAPGPADPGTSAAPPRSLTERLKLLSEPAPAPGYPTTTPSPVLAAEIARVAPAAIAAHLGSPHAEERRIAARALGRVGGDDAAQQAAQVLRDPDASVRVEACFAIGVTGSSLAAGLLSPVLEGKPTPAEIAAIALGIAGCTDDAATDLLVRICCRDDRPVEGPEALFRHARWRTQPLPKSLPNDRMLAYETHPTARGRAGLGWLGRIWKDPRLLAPLLRLASDAEPEVRRAVAMGLAEARTPDVRPPADADRAVAGLRAFLKDADARVVASACRALGTYDRADAVDALRGALGHADFNVRVAAAESLGARKAGGAAEDLERLATRDPSVSVRYAAATQLASFDAARAAKLVDGLLANPSEYVRSAGAEILAKAADDASIARLAALAASDPHVRVRETALDGLKEKKGAVAFAAVKAALASTDSQIVAVAADVVATNAWKELVPDVRAAFARFPRAGDGVPWDATRADAREGIVTALAKMSGTDDDALLRETAALDTDPGPRFAAQSAFAQRAAAAAAQAAAASGAKPPEPPAPPKPERLPTPCGDAIPGGAPLLAKDVDLVVETDRGTMRIRLDAAAAPVHASHVAYLASRGFYDGLTWHRVVPDFVVQGGCPRGDGAGNAGVTLALEPTRIPFEKGTLGMPRSGHPDTGGCQWFICHSRAPHLDVQYTAFGRVIEGLDVIDRIDVDSTIVRVRVAEAR